MMPSDVKFHILIILILAEIDNISSYNIHINRQPSSDSIMEIMNRKYIDRVLAEKQLAINNIIKQENRSFLNNNEIDEEDTDFLEFAEPTTLDTYQQQQKRYPIDSDLSDVNSNERLRSPSSALYQQNVKDNYIMQQQNDSQLHQQIIYSNDILPDLQKIRTDKLLKSTKAALFVTRREYLKKDWCKTEPIVQRIRVDGCLTRTIINRFCYGQCNSFYIPKSPKRNRNPGMVQSGSIRSISSTTSGNFGHNIGNTRSKVVMHLNSQMDDLEPEDLTGAAFRSCAVCKPKKFVWVTIFLRCPALMPQIRRKKIQKIKHCRCLSE